MDPLYSYIDPQCQEEAKLFQEIFGSIDPTTIPIGELRALFEKVQASSRPSPEVAVTHFLVNTSHGKVKTFLYKPTAHELDPLPVIFFLRGGGWIAGSAKFFQAIVDDLVLRTGFAVVLPEYTLAPEEQFPVQQEQCLEVIEYIVQHGSSKGLATERIVTMGDCTGVQLVTAVSILNTQRELELPIVHQFLLQPASDITSFSKTFSEWKFQNGPVDTVAVLNRMVAEEFPNVSDRSEITASAGLMTKEQAVKFMPPTTIITYAVDLLRDNGEQFAQLLQTAGVECSVIRLVACTHDTVSFNKSRKSPTSELAMIAISGKVREVLGGDTAIRGKKRKSSRDEGAANGTKHKLVKQKTRS